MPQWFLLTEDVFSSSLAPSVLWSPWVGWLVSCNTWSSSFSLTEPLLNPPLYWSLCSWGVHWQASPQGSHAPCWLLRGLLQQGWGGITDKMSCLQSVTALSKQHYQYVSLFFLVPLGTPCCLDKHITIYRIISRNSIYSDSSRRSCSDSVCIIIYKLFSDCHILSYVVIQMDDDFLFSHSTMFQMRLKWLLWYIVISL